MGTLSVKLPAELAARLDAESRRTHRTRSDVVRLALTAHLERAGGDSRGFLERAGDLVGSLEGPGDLSTNPEHLEDFGR